MFNVQRPSSKDTEDDILKLQEDFLKEKSKPAAVIDNKKHVSKESKTPETSSNSNEKDGEEIDVSSTAVMFGIKEHNYRVGSAVVPPCRNPEPFPAVSKRNPDVKTRKGKSIFAQQMEKLKSKELSKSSVTNPTVKLFKGPVIIDGSGLPKDSAEEDLRKIHEDNIAKLSALTEEEILTEQMLLLEKLDPNTIDFVRKKRQSELVKATRKCASPFPRKSSDQTSSSYSGFLLPSSAPVNQSSEEHEIFKITKGHDRDGIILESIPESVLSDAPPNMDTSGGKNESDTTYDTELPEEELPIDLKDASQYVHMDKVEKQKLKWMTLLPKPKPVDIKSGCTARFDLEGKLLLSDGSVLTDRGLHHHSEEPELPGYTVEELFLLSRSSTQSQRVLALKVLSFIIENNYQGLFDECFEDPLLVSLLNAGLVPLLRWALDDSTDSSIAIAVMAIHHLLVCSTDELCLDMAFSWPYGHLSPFIKPYDDDQVPEENLENLSDANIIKLDVIKGFLRMDLLPRLRYILEVTCPPLPVCYLIIEILTRLARHSSDSAKQVVECPFLLEVIFKKFLPLGWNLAPSDDDTKKTNDFVFPIPHAVKLVRIICSSDITLAADLIERHRLDSLLTYYLSLGLSDVKLSAATLQKLVIEALRTWRVLLAYGFCSEVYIELFPVLMKQLQYFGSVSINLDSGIHDADYMYASVFFKALEAVVVVAADCKKLFSRSGSPLPLTPVMWHHLTALLPMAENCLQRWLYEFSHGETTTASSVLLASCVDFFGVYCIKTREQQEIESEHKIKGVITDYLLPCLKSVRFSSSLDKLQSFSVLLYNGSSGTRRNANTLTQLGSIMWDGNVVPILKEGTPFPLVMSVIGLLTKLTKLLRGFEIETAKLILFHPSIVKYVRQVSITSHHFKHWFDRFEVVFFSLLIELASLEVCGDPVMWHKLSLSLLSNIRATDEWIVKYLMENLIFNDALLLCNISRLDLNCTEEILKEKLQKICQVYVNFFLSPPSLEKSRQKWLKCIYDFPVSVGDDLKSKIPDDWPYKPLLELHQLSKNSEVSSAELTAQVACFLEWIYLLQVLQLPAFEHVSSSLAFCHLCFVYNLGSDLFLDSRIKDILQSCLTFLVKHRKLDDLERTQWNNSSKYDDLFSDLVVQFEAESYGDHVFANYLVVAFQQCYPSSWKKFVFIEHPQAIRIIRIPLSELIVPLTNFLDPKETDTDLLTLYIEGLLSELLVPKRSPLLYLMGVSHLHRYIFMCAEQPTEFQRTLLNTLMQCKRKEVIRHVLLYKNPSENEELGFEMDESLTSECELHLCNLYGKPVVL